MQLIGPYTSTETCSKLRVENIIVTDDITQQQHIDVMVGKISPRGSCCFQLYCILPLTCMDFFIYNYTV